MEALDAVGMADVADRSPHHLSFGERRRVALATVLAMRPDVLVLDEPSSNLDPVARRELAEIVLGLDVTILLVTHDLPYALQLCERAVVLDAGRVAVDGPIGDVLADRETMAAHRLELPYGFDPCARSLLRVSEYRPPLEDMRFVLEPRHRHRACWPTMPGYEHADPATVDGILEEAGRFFAEQFAPLNRVGDVQHSRRHDDGRVVTPDGFPRRTSDTSRPAGRRCRSRPSTAAAGSRGSSASPCRR